jgi:D-3-phosphoglycerate dehydrogenase
VEFAPIEDLLARADIVTLHVSLDNATQGFFGQSEFQAMRQGALLINTSRGELLDESALLKALETGKIAGAALDVLSNEQGGDLKGHPLIEYATQRENLLITPHIGGCTVESMAKTETFLAQKIVRALSSGDNQATRMQAPALALS